MEKLTRDNFYQQISYGLLLTAAATVPWSRLRSEQMEQMSSSEIILQQEQYFTSSRSLSMADVK